MSLLDGRTVVVAEPDALVARGLEAVIGGWGGVMRPVAPSTVGLLDALVGAAPDLLLVNADLLGGADGVRFFSAWCGTPAVAMMSSCRPPRRDGHGGFPCLEMPFTIDALQSAIAQALRAPRAADRQRVP